MHKIFNPNKNIKSRKKIMSTSWKKLSGKKPSEYLQVSLSRFGDTKNAGGATIRLEDKNGNLFYFSPPPLRTHFGNLRMNCAPVKMPSGKEKFPPPVDCNDKKAKRIFQSAFGFDEFTKDYLREQHNMSDAKFSELSNDQMAFKEWEESVVKWFITSAAALCVGKERAKTEAWMKDNQVNGGFLVDFMKMCSKKSCKPQDIYNILEMQDKNGALRTDKDSNTGATFFKITLKHDVLNYRFGTPKYPLMKDARNPDFDPVSMVPTQEQLDKIWILDGEENGKKQWKYNGLSLDDEGKQLEPRYLKRGDMWKPVYRVKFYQGGCGISRELTEALLIKRKLYSELGKRQATSELNREDVQDEIDAYFG